MTNLQHAAQEIREILEEKRNQLKLSFIEEDHVYFMEDTDGKYRNNFPSVSKVLKKFYREFPTEEAALNKAGGDYLEAERLMAEWKQLGEESTNMGSRVHYFLETELINRNGGYKEVRKPIFNCDLLSMNRGDQMIVGGKKYLDLCEERGLVLLDTEMVLGHPDLGYTGQPDKVWLTMNAKGDGFGILITDWKTNKEKNFQTNKFTEGMYAPFEEYPNNALGHYYLQLPFYGKLLLKMLEGTKYENIKLLGCIVVLVKDDSTYQEFRVPKNVIQTILDLDTKSLLERSN
jgi:hypothetical protein